MTLPTRPRVMVPQPWRVKPRNPTLLRSSAPTLRPELDEAFSSRAGIAGTSGRSEHQ